jgi:hypothetical protein
MLDHIFSSSVKLVGIVGTIFGTVTLAEMKSGAAYADWFTGLERMGSFFLLALLFLAGAWGISKIVPGFLAGIERTKDQFLTELKEERLSREKSVDAFRDMLGAHKDELGKKLDEGNNLTRKLVEEITKRPCQIDRK